MAGGDHRCTPSRILDIAELVHRIDLDPCGHHFSDPRAKTRWFGPPEGTDGLLEPWEPYVTRIGAAWVNPMWRHAEAWADKCASEAVTSFLWLPCYPETAAAQIIWRWASAIAFWKERVQHELPPHLRKKKREVGSMWPMWLSYFGPRAQRFARIMKPYAHVVTSWTK